MIMLTSASLPRGGAHARDESIAAYLTKPVKQSELLDAIVTAFATGLPAKTPRRIRARSQGRRPFRILVAEDNAANQKLVVTLLEQRGHTVVLASNGRQAAARAAEQPFDVILMDVQMPEMDGLEATSAIRERERPSGSHVPIVAMTAHAMAGDRERCLQAGMDGYVSKPLRPDELLDAIDKAVGCPPAVPQDELAGEKTGPALDRATLLACYGGNRKLLVEVIGAFLDDAPARVAAVRRAADAQDAPATASVAHALKGSVGLFVQDGAYDAARRLERAAKEGRTDDLRALAAELETEMAALTAGLADVASSL
jgi:CheY-like chemotaxis protein/HPt (histidine-containing phosphotransfer) domain-containing protein